MLFNSFHFLLFFPVVSILYYLIPHRMRWMWLLACSYYFYMSWNPKYAILMAVSTIITYLSGRLINWSNNLSDERKRTFQKKLWVALSFCLNLAILFFFKYFDFAVSNLNSLLAIAGISRIQPTFDVLLPVGISFYTFQALSYTIDVYRNDIYAERNILKYALFVSFFPQLVAGPIERSKNLLIQVNERHVFDYDQVKNGLLLMVWVFFQKLVIADRAALLVDEVYNNYSQYAGVQMMVATVFFAVQIYCDFSGYSDIAIGAAQVMGFRLMSNFRQPYFADSIQDFWRRWHISLSTWFRDYLYIPLGGSRCSRPRKYCNLLITFLVSGLWHGASWSYVVWGGLHGLYQIAGDLSRTYRSRLYAKLHIRTAPLSFRLGKMVTTFLLVDFAWIFFRANSTRDAFRMIKRMLTEFHLRDVLTLESYMTGLNPTGLGILLFSILTLFAVSFVRSRYHDIRKALATQNVSFRWAVYYAAVIGVLVMGVILLDNTQAQFLYFQF